MTNYPYSHDPDDTLDEAYMRWLDKNGFPAMRQLLADQGCEDVAVLRSVPNREALGVFHAVSTRDGEAQARDGQAFYALNRLDSQADEAIVEIQFGDGTWMLATPTDLEIQGPVRLYCPRICDGVCRPGLPPFKTLSATGVDLLALR